MKKPLHIIFKSQKFHSEFQAVETEVEHTIFAIAAMFVLNYRLIS